MSSPYVFDVCIVGAGLWGSAAAKYCSEQEGISVCLIGPSEQAPLYDCERSSMLGAHHDAGRIYARVNTNTEWAQLALRSVANYKKITEKSGIQFYSSVGLLWITSAGGSKGKKLNDNAKQLGVNVKHHDKESLHRKFSFLSFQNIFPKKGTNFKIECLEMENAGYFNPRNLILAQKMIAHQQGCEIVDDIVIQIGHSDKQDILKLITSTKNVYHAKKVLLCTGASTVFDCFIPNNMKLDLVLKSQEVLLVELTKSDRERFYHMPSIIVHEGGGDFGKDCYILPPIQYPDGKFYLKIGHCRVDEFDITSEKEMQTWYCGNGVPTTANRLGRLIHEICPGLTPLSLRSDTCVTVTTPTNQLYCDMVTPNLGILVGGNGGGAKSSDEIGLMGAKMILKGEWDYDLPWKSFRAKWKSTIACGL